MNAFINYVSYPTSAKSLEHKIDDNGRTDMEELVTHFLSGNLCTDDFCPASDMIPYGIVDWTISPNAKEGDLVVFFHTKSALEKIKAVEEEAKKDEELYAKLKPHIEKSYEYFDLYGSSIFAVGEVVNDPERDDDAFDYPTHFKTRTFTYIMEVMLLEKPIKAEQLSEFWNLKEQTSIEPIDKEIFIKLIELIKETNEVDERAMNYFDEYKNQ